MNKEWLFNIIELILLFALVILPIRMFLLEPFLVQGESMEPNFHNFDYLIIDKLSYRLQKPKRGDIIVFHPPFDKNIYYIKRLIGLPKERIVINDDKIIIYNEENPLGFVLKENYLQNHYTAGYKNVTLGEDEYFVLGDNREVSYDSRSWGTINKKNIVGKVLFQLSFVKLARALKF